MGINYYDYNFKQGEMVLLTREEYADLSNIGLYVVHKDFHVGALLRKYVELYDLGHWIEQAWNWGEILHVVENEKPADNIESFIQYLQRENYLKSCNYRTLWMGSYNELSFPLPKQEKSNAK